MTYEEYIQWAKNSLKELNELLGIPKAFLKKGKEK